MEATSAEREAEHAGRCHQKYCGEEGAGGSRIGSTPIPPPKQFPHTNTLPKMGTLAEFVEPRVRVWGAGGGRTSVVDGDDPSGASQSYELTQKPPMRGG